MMTHLCKTADGSYTLYSEKYLAHYHSIHGALTESKLVYLHSAFLFYSLLHDPKEITVAEMGLGIGMNAMLTADNTRIHTFYDAFEINPISEETFAAFICNAKVGEQKHKPLRYLQKIYDAPWGKGTEIDEFFHIRKHMSSIEELNVFDLYNVWYYDAFSPHVQPELWTEEVFSRIYRSMTEGGVLSTYCSKGEVRRTLQDCGFRVEKLPGPPGKREIIRCIKI